MTGHDEHVSANSRLMRQGDVEIPCLYITLISVFLIKTKGRAHRERPLVREDSTQPC